MRLQTQQKEAIFDRVEQGLDLADQRTALGVGEEALEHRLSGQPKARDLRYQLLTACAGALAEAQRRQLTRAVMLVHEFITPAIADGNHNRNAADLQGFVERLSGRTGLLVKNGELQGPFVFPDDVGIDLYLVKVTQNLRGCRD